MLVLVCKNDDIKITQIPASRTHSVDPFQGSLGLDIILVAFGLCSQARGSDGVLMLWNPGSSSLRI